MPNHPNVPNHPNLPNHPKGGRWIDPASMVARDATVERLMRRDFIAIGPEESRFGADRLMRMARVRHVPIVSEGHLVGVLSHRDLLMTIVEEQETRLSGETQTGPRSGSIEPLVQTDLVSVEPDCRPARAVALMLRTKVGFLPVVERRADGLRLIGIVTESDLLRDAYGDEIDDAGD